MPAPATPGRLLITAVILSLIPGAFIADYNATHLFNPRWPPHARFHNAQTMSMSVALTLPTLWYAWRAPRGPRTAADDLSDSIVTATIFASIYPLTSLAAWFFPTVLAVDPEFGEGFPQLPIFTTGLALTWAGCWLELARVRKLKAKAA